MSGDVQPRKRKEKRRKKVDGVYTIQRIRGTSFDDEDAGTPPPNLVSASEHSGDNLTIHVHKEGGTGGHWCARIIFFALLTILIGLIGIIILEHRGNTDVNTPVAESRWATIFDGWVDDTSLSHNDESHIGHDEDHEKNHEEASEETDEHEEGDKEEIDDEQDSDEGEHSDEERSEETDKREKVAVKSDDNISEEEDEGIGSEEEEEDVIGSSEEGQDDDVLREEGDGSNEIGDDNIDQQGFEEVEEFIQRNSDNDDVGTLEEVYNTSGEDNDSAEKEEDDVINASDNELDVSIEGVKTSEEQNNDDISDEFLGIPGITEVDDNSAEPLEEGFESKIDERTKDNLMADELFVAIIENNNEFKEDLMNDSNERERNNNSEENISEASNTENNYKIDWNTDSSILGNNVDGNIKNAISNLKNSVKSTNIVQHFTQLNLDNQENPVEFINDVGNEINSVRNVKHSNDDGRIENPRLNLNTFEEKVDFIKDEVVRENSQENGKLRVKDDLSLYVETSVKDTDEENNIDDENSVTEIELLSKAQFCDKSEQCERINTDIYKKDSWQNTEVDKSLDAEAFEMYFKDEMESIDSIVNAQMNRRSINDLSDDTAVDFRDEDECPGPKKCSEDSNASNSNEIYNDDIVKVEDEETEDVVNDVDVEPEVEEVEEESTGVAVKFGVGVALVVAAHFVLVRRWNNADINISGTSADSDEAPDLSRRNTIVPPPHIEQVVPTIDTEQDQSYEVQQTQSYEDLRLKYKGLKTEDNSKDIFAKETADSQIEKVPIKNIWMEHSPAREELKPLQQSRTKDTSEGEEEEEKEQEEEEEEELETSEGGRVSGTEEEEEEEDQENEDFDDKELVAKLEAKYGKLPTPPVSEEENDNEEEEEEEEEDEDEDEDIQGWKRVKAPKDSESESEDEPRPVVRAVPKTREGSTTGGAKNYDFTDASSPEDIIIREEIASGLGMDRDD